MTDLFGIQIDMLRAAELQFRLASAVRLAATDRRQPLDLPIVWTHGKHSVAFHEVALSPEGADFAAMCFAAFRDLFNGGPNPRSTNRLDKWKRPPTC